MSGIAAALLLPKIFNQPVLWSIERNIAIFPMILGISAIVSIVISLVTEPDDEEVLKKFYKQVRPWGFWRPIRDKVMRDDPAFRPNKNFGRDMINIAVGIVWQLTLILIPTYLLIRSYRNMWISVAVLLATSIFLKKSWYDKLETD